MSLKGNTHKQLMNNLGTTTPTSRTALLNPKRNGKHANCNLQMKQAAESLIEHNTTSMENAIVQDTTQLITN